jgi:GMP synthase (glutamine-hydrolysing)
MAAALGAKVYPAGFSEIGFGSLSLSEAGFNSPLKALDGAHVLHWHGDTFDLPDGASLLASTSLIKHQAYAIGSYALGLQFHAELDPAYFEQWLIGHAAEISNKGLDPKALRADCQQYGPRLAKAGEQMFLAWLTEIGL